VAHASHVVRRGKWDRVVVDLKEQGEQRKIGIYNSKVAAFFAAQLELNPLSLRHSLESVRRSPPQRPTTIIAGARAGCSASAPGGARALVRVVSSRRPRDPARRAGGIRILRLHTKRKGE
jgi:hypothetical protein